MGPVLTESLRSRFTMRAFVFVLLATVSVHAEAGADPYTVGQVAHGLTSGGIITGVDHGHGVVSGVGAIGNRAVRHVAGVSSVYPNVYSSVYPNVYSGVNHVYGKREAEAEAEAEAGVV